MHCDDSITIMWSLKIFINGFPLPCWRAKNSVLSRYQTSSVARPKMWKGPKEIQMFDFRQITVADTLRSVHINLPQERRTREARKTFE